MSWRAAHSRAMAEPGAAVEPARVLVDGLPGVGRLGELPVHTQAFAVLRRASPAAAASRGSAPRARSRCRCRRGRAAAPRRARRARTAVSSSSVSSSARLIRRFVSSVPSPSAVIRRKICRRQPAAVGPRAPRKRASAVCAIARSMPPVDSYPARVSVVPRRRRHVSSSACDSSGSTPGWPVASATSRETSAFSTRYPASTAGREIACRSSSVVIGPTRTWASCMASASSACRAQWV